MGWADDTGKRSASIVLGGPEPAPIVLAARLMLQG